MSLVRIFSAQTGIGPLGFPMRSDFISFWTASALALQGRPEAAYDMPAHRMAEQALFSDMEGYSAFFYPPVFLVICLPTALLPYFWSLAAWIAATGFAYLRVMKRLMPRGTLPILAFPAVLMNVIYGQNGFLTTALFGAGIMLLRRHPIPSGLCFGCLIYKPHLALALPFALLVRKEWTTLASAFVTAIGLCSLSFILLGSRTWAAFLAATPMARATLEQGLIEPHNWASTFAGVRLLHGSIASRMACNLWSAWLSSRRWRLRGDRLTMPSCRACCRSHPFWPLRTLSITICCYL
jgi:hypothetical protein